jgi:hypothetical protein
MAQLIAIKIDVSKIDKARLFEGKNGAKYLDAVVFVNPEQGQYGDNGMITQSVSKEERDSGVKGNILGNVKVLGDFADNNGGSQNQSGQQGKPNSSFDTDSDSIPF